MRHLHRSLLFWLGLPAFLFILWSWHDSMTREVGITRSYSLTRTTSFGSSRVTTSDFIGQYRATLLIQWHLWTPEHLGKITIVPPKVTINTLPPSHEEGWRVVFPPYWNGGLQRPLGDAGAVSLRKIAIPHWQILLLYTLAWFGLIAWRTRRVKRLKKTAALDASPSTDAAA